MRLNVTIWHKMSFFKCFLSVKIFLSFALFWVLCLSFDRGYTLFNIIKTIDNS